ncbi:diguanylate cyclase [Pseudomonas monteilii]|uniref:diguanylate cyclase n=1 Tax=Pseudomonas monteilii TaxID=76759 RepID=A0AAE6RE61_9PSED|nr:MULTISPECIES: sensor domain-containing diguanylate cyclase [Pseudomonas]MBH3455097.1 diguanylate cyclase [Pseudomonas monteilii]MDI3371227.1 diguanylate cyclase [Pseudomonas sp. V104_10]NBB03391.1 diguanylate cyclase [Pseudomonas monteilii]PXX72740.1 PAS domain S-box-containing protein/diguanylate cyclase (GGDEF)-like protein [Pseudomonas sp. LAIL14HWK12:I1]QHB29291.1 sensory box protein [Pseudomonas monteilii]
MNQETRPAPAGFSEQQLHTLFELISDGIWDWNANTGYVYRNPGWYAMLGYASHSMANSVLTWESVIHPEDYPRVMAHFEAYIRQHNERYLIEYRCRCHDGSYLWIEDSGYIIDRNEDGSVARMLGAHRNIDAGKRLVEQLEQKNQSLEGQVAERTRELSWVNQQLQRQLDENRELAERDALTRIANRYRLEKALQRECERAQRFRQPLSLIAMDLDDFKPINDRYGHARGDAALVRVVDSLRTCLRELDLLARWGGDEFVIVLPQSTLGEALDVAGRLRQVMAQLEPVGECRLTMSYGVVQWQEGEDQHALLARADKAMYRAKGAGKNAIAE